MKQIINLKPKDKVTINEIEQKIKSARNSNDYILINFGRKGEFIKVAFSRDQTYCIGYNFWHMEFSIKTNILIKQYPKTVNGVLANWLSNWVIKLNH